MLTKSFHFIDDDSNLNHYPYQYFSSKPGDLIFIGEKVYINVRGSKSNPKSLSGPYYTAVMGNDNYISQDLLKLCEFIKDKLSESN